MLRTLRSLVNEFTRFPSVELGSQTRENYEKVIKSIHHGLVLVTASLFF